MSSFKIRILVFLGALTIIGIFIMQGVYIFKNYNKEEGEFHRAVNIALRNTAVEIAKYNGVKLPEKGLIKMESSNIYEVNVNSPIDQAILQTYLETEFDKQGITTLFEYGIYNCNTNELVFSECCLVAKTEKKVTVKKNKGKKNRRTIISLYAFLRKIISVGRDEIHLVFYHLVVYRLCDFQCSHHSDLETKEVFGVDEGFCKQHDP
ncbi:MAG: hypothetical protein IPI90_15965 [Saprospiraceae bacterium]|nr:hypothetical protein [Candidatus Vicinibacter affinis]